MRWLLFLRGLLLLSSGIARAEMVPNDLIGSDPEKEKLCASRALAGRKGITTVPFRIDSRYVASVRSSHPDATFVVIDGGAITSLVTCFLREGTGRFEPDSYGGGPWEFIDQPRQYEPGPNGLDTYRMAAKICLEAAPAKINRPNLDHSVHLSVNRIWPGGPLYNPGTSIGGKRAERFDWAVEGKSFYKSSGPDLAAVKFTCLLSPMLEVKAIQYK